MLKKMKLTLTMTFPFKDSGEGKQERLSLAGVLYNVSENDDDEKSIIEDSELCFLIML